MINLLVLFVSIIISSGLCSMSEAAILSLPLVRARILFEQKRKHAKDLLYIKEHIAYAVASIVIINNAINIVGSIFIGQHVAARFGNQWLGVASTVLTFSIIVMSEIIPKTIGERFKVKISLFFARPIRLIVILFRPIVSMIMKMTRSFIAEKKLPRVTEEEIKMMLRLGRVEGTVEMDEEVLCNRVFKLNDVRAVQIMRPIDDMFALPADKTLGEMREQIIKSRFSRIVIYNKSPLDILGVAQQRVLLREIAKDNYKAHVKDFMKPPIFVNWFTKADELLAKFQAYNQHLFIVQDAQHKSVGIVTMEDVLEELFGEIYDEKDNVKPKGLILDDFEV
ncbi:MAG: CNNM domain-containing protein [Candidatus Omnitrophica bacterium]|nr:CNNM domain-containing protein [Candidatus Omnitrophota bacterium]